MEISNPALILAPIMLIVGLILGRELTRNSFKFNISLPKIKRVKKTHSYNYRPIKAKVVRRRIEKPTFFASYGRRPHLTKVHKIGLFAVTIVTIAIVAINFAGPISFTGFFVKSANPAKITGLSYEKSGNDLIFKFGLQDNNSKTIVTNGNVTLKILNNGNVIKEEKFSLTKDDATESIYSISIDYNSLEKTYDGIGKATIIFETNGKTVQSTIENIDIPKYTEAELNQMYIDNYNKNALVLDRKIEKECGPTIFKVTLKKIGYYNKWENGKEIIRVRADISVENTGDERASFQENWNKNDNYKLVDNKGNKYLPSDESTFRGGMLNPGETINGYLIFDNFDSSARTATLYLDSGWAIETAPGEMPIWVVFTFSVDASKF
ncbi:MAG: hypothetical protein J7K26_00855 [Candidatus Aenigmarchaeota archaeon]|nr:hypothetical protein [Candidatus Aenigmarchaeota archaeon]